MKKLIFLLLTILASLLFHLIWGFINLPGFKEVAILFDYPFSLFMAVMIVVVYKKFFSADLNKGIFYIVLIINIIFAPIFLTYIAIPTSMKSSEMASQRYYNKVGRLRINLELD